MRKVAVFVISYSFISLPDIAIILHKYCQLQGLLTLARDFAPGPHWGSAPRPPYRLAVKIFHHTSFI
jgi:hypothetical protein